MAITFWANFNHGPVTDVSDRSEYTLGATEYSAGGDVIDGAGLFGRIAIAAPGGDWASRNVLSFADHWSLSARMTEDVANLAGNRGRMLVLMEITSSEALSTSQPFFGIHAATAANGEYIARIGGGNMVVRGRWNSGQEDEVGLGTAITEEPIWIEIKWDMTLGTANQRLQARMWALGDSPGSFQLCSGAHSYASIDAFTTLRIGNPGNTAAYRYGHIIVSDDPDDDLTAYTDTEAYPTGPEAAVLSSPSVISIGATGATLRVTSDTADGEIRAVVTASATPPSAAQIWAGNDHTGTAALATDAEASPAASTNDLVFTGLTPGATGLYAYAVQQVDSEFSNVVSAGPFDLIEYLLRVKEIGSPPSSLIKDINTGDPIPDGAYTVITVPVGDVASGTIRRHSVSVTDGALADIEDAAYTTLEAEFHLIGLSSSGAVRFHADSEVIDGNA